MEDPMEATGGQVPHDWGFGDPCEQSTDAGSTGHEGVERAEPAAPEMQRRTVRCSLCGAVVELLVQAAVSGTAPCQACGFRLVWSAPDPSPNHSAQADDHRPEVDQVERWLSADPVRLKSPTDRQWLGRCMRRHPRLTATLFVVAVLVTATALLSTFRQHQTQSQLSRTDRQLQEALDHSRDADSLAAENARLAGARQREVQTERAARQIAERRLREEEESRKLTERRLAQIKHQQAETQGDTRLKVAQELAKESRAILSSHPTQSVFLASQAMRTTIEEGGVPDHEARQTLQDALSMTAGQGFTGHLAEIRSLAISPDGRWVLSGSDDATARLWDIDTEDPSATAIVLRGHQESISAVAVTPDSRWLVTAGHDATAMLWDLTKPDPSQEPLVLRGHTGPINAVAVSASGRWLATVSGDLSTDDNSARLWDLTRNDPSEAPVVLRGHDKPVVCVAISRDSHWIVTGSQDGTVRRFDLTARFPAAAQMVFAGHQGTVSAVAIGPDSQRMVTGGHDGTARVWELASQEPTQQSTILRGHTGPVSSVAISPRGDLIATGSFDQTARLWLVTDADPQVASVVLKGHADRIHVLQFSPDGQTLVTGSSDRTARLWDLTAEDPGRTPVILRGHTDRVSSLAISPDGRWLATGSGNARGLGGPAVRLWDLDLNGLLDAAQNATAGRISDADRSQAFLNAAGRVRAAK
jgi:WD40 repeat protein